MEDLFIVCENYNQNDHEGWQSWVDSRDLSYHKTLESAEVAIKVLVEANTYYSENDTKDKFLSCDGDGMIDIYSCRRVDLQG